MFSWIRTRLARKSAHRPIRFNKQLACEALEDRTTPTVSSITSNFNGTAIPAGDYLWFSSVAKVSGLGSTPATVHVTDQTISFTAAGTQYTLDVPDSTIVFDPADTSASANFTGGWQVASPSNFSGNVFLSGLSYQLSSRLPGGVKNVVWSGDFTSDTAGLNIKWQWAAAAYSQFSSDSNALGVKASDAPTSVYHNSDHAGTPENYRTFVVGGARGGGGSNFTGSMSATEAVVPTQALPPEGSLSGHVFIDANQDGVIDPNEDGGIGGVTIHLFDAIGNEVATTTTNDDGSYSFTGLAAGTYSISEDQPNGFVDGNDYLGSLGGSLGNDQFSAIQVLAGQSGVNYDFTETRGE